MWCMWEEIQVLQLFSRAQRSPRRRWWVIWSSRCSSAREDEPSVCPNFVSTFCYLDQIHTIMSSPWKILKTSRKLSRKWDQVRAWWNEGWWLWNHNESQCLMWMWCFFLISVFCALQKREVTRASIVENSTNTSTRIRNTWLFTLLWVSARSHHYRAFVSIREILRDFYIQTWMLSSW